MEGMLDACMLHRSPRAHDAEWDRPGLPPPVEYGGNPWREEEEDDDWLPLCCGAVSSSRGRKARSALGPPPPTVPVASEVRIPWDLRHPPTQVDGNSASSGRPISRTENAGGWDNTVSGWNPSFSREESSGGYQGHESSGGYPGEGVTVAVRAVSDDVDSPASASTAPVQLGLDGFWKSRGATHCIRGATIFWPSGNVTDIEVLAPGDFYTILDGQAFRARLEANRKQNLLQIIWSDGDVWTCQPTGVGFEGNLLRQIAELPDLAGLRRMDTIDVTKLTALELTCSKPASVDDLGIQLTGLVYLTSLTLDLSSCRGLQSVDKLGRGLAHLARLNLLRLILDNCKKLTNIDELSKGLSFLTTMTLLELSLAFCSNLLSVDALGVGLAHLSSLDSLSLNLWGCRSLANLDELGRGLPYLSTLQHLKLNLESCSQVQSLAELGNGLARLTWVTSLEMNLVECAGLQSNHSFNSLAQGMARLESVTSLTLNLERCDLVSTDLLGDKIECLRNLTSMTLDLASCKALMDLDRLGSGLEHLSRLSALRLDLYGCDQLLSIDSLGRGIASLVDLTSLTLDLTRCRKLRSADEVGKGLHRLGKLRSLNLNFNGCGDLTRVDDFKDSLSHLAAKPPFKLNFILEHCSGLSANLQKHFVSVESFVYELGVATEAKTRQAIAAVYPPPRAVTPTASAHSPTFDRSFLREERLEVCFLPTTLDGFEILRQDSLGTWTADNSRLNSTSEGIKYRTSKDTYDVHAFALVRWGQTIEGQDEGDGWVRCINVPVQATATSAMNFTSILTSDQGTLESPVAGLTSILTSTLTSGQGDQFGATDVIPLFAQEQDSSVRRSEEPETGNADRLVGSGQARDSAYGFLEDVAT